MLRLLFAILLLAPLKSDAAFLCDWTGIEVDGQGCVNYSWFKIGLEEKCSNIPNCFKLEIIEQKEKKKEYFLTESLNERKKIIPILDSSAVPLLRNKNLKDIKIIFYNKEGKLSKEFMKEAEQYLLEKGIKREQFKIEIR